MKRILASSMAAAGAVVLSTAPAFAAGATTFKTPETCTTSGPFTSCTSSSGVHNETTTPSDKTSAVTTGTNHTTITGPDVNIDFTVHFTVHTLIEQPGGQHQVTAVQKTTDINGGVACRQVVVMVFANGEFRAQQQNFECV